MKYVIVGKNMEVSSSLEKAVMDKLGKLRRTPRHMSRFRSTGDAISSKSRSLLRGM